MSAARLGSRSADPASGAAPGLSQGQFPCFGRLLAFFFGAPPRGKQVALLPICPEPVPPMANLYRLTPLAFLPILTSMALAACSSDPNGTDTTPGDAKNGEQLYLELCAGCHGNAAEGGLGPRLAPWTRSVEELVSTIDKTMPQGEPEKCGLDCAEDIAAYLTGLTLSCDGPRALPQRLRLLTRREYRNTVTDLFQASLPSACQIDADCNLETESCIGGACTADPCNLVTFVYDAGNTNPSTVHVAGNFNGWPGTVAAGGWGMQKAAGTNLYYVKHELAAGSYEYKFVINESQWISDPSNPNQVGDFGNSALTLSCSAPPGGGGLGFDPAQDLPAESRPSGFAFDNHENALATSVHVDQYWKAAALLADAAMTDSVNLLPCDLTIDTPACAEDFVADFGKRAFRRPLTVQEIAKYKGILLSADKPETGVKNVLRTLLSSPYFLYKSEVGEPLGDGTYRLTGYETASLLSYMFWSTTPDGELLEAAESGELQSKTGIEKQARRLLQHPRSRPTFETFASQWLGIEQVPALSKNGALYPEWNDALASSMVQETKTFFTHVAFDGSRKYSDLVTSDTTFINTTLATFYGLPSPAQEFGEVSSPAERQAGLLGQASILAVNAYADQSSPIRRGLFVRRSLLCQDLPPPPANAATLPVVDPNATTRERFAQHTKDPACHDCHQYIDDLGFGFEKFDAVGRYRETENGQPIDASGDMNDVEGLGTGTHSPFNSLSELGETLAQSHTAKACFAKQTYRFALGRLETADDTCGLTHLSTAFEKSGGDIQELWIELTLLDETTRRK
ncbi:MAG: DUF1592 domain-containing protein [Polyangiaceae bacterium]|nr:DUF1592 domain-containing protein [Polyangiaceae bacterium]